MPSLININSVSPDLRDYLLGLNLKPSPTIKDNNYTQFLNGVGLPFTVTYGNGVLAPFKNVLDFAKIAWRPAGLGLNKYQGDFTSDIVDTGIVISKLYVNNSQNYQLKPYNINNIQFLGSNTKTPNIYTSNNNPSGPLSYSANTDEGYKFYLKNVFYKENVNNYEVIHSSAPTGPGFPALTETKDTKGNVYGPNTNLNKYKGDVNDKQYVGPFINQTIGVINQKDSYLNEYGKLNVKNGQFDEAFNIVSSLIKGGVGINKDGNGIGVVSNNDVRNTLVGRVLTASGAIGDTDLGIIGAERLAISLTNNAVFKFQRQTIGKVNLQLFNYIDNNGIGFDSSSNNRVIKENFEITIPDNIFGKSLDFLGDLVGFTSPKSQLGVEFFSFDNKLRPTLIGNIARANAMLDSTGKGQVKALFDNVRASLKNSNLLRQGYAPGYESRGEIWFPGQDAPRFNVYAYGDLNGEIIEHQNLGNRRWTDADGSGFEGDYFRYTTLGNSGNTGNESSSTESGFVWADTNINVDKNEDESLIKDADEIFGDSPSKSESNSLHQTNRKSILYKTKELFKTNNVQTMVNGHVTITEKSQIQTSVLPNGMMSKGNAALTKYALETENLTDLTNVYCRTWTPMDKYDQVRDLVRHSSLNKQGGDYKRDKKLIEYSVLESTGFVKIASYLKENNESAKRYMFSIENLAWIGQTITTTNGKNLKLPNCEIGPNNGRIMWFPPYDIKFSESTSVNWDKHNFIGRGEPMYTYSNTERTGQLSFKIIIDHPNSINNKNNNVTQTDDQYASFFAGCNLEDLIPTDKTITTTTKTKKEIVDNPTDVKPPVFSVFFPNDNWEYPNNNPAYESGISGETGLNNRNLIVYTNNDKDTYINPINYNTKMNPTQGPLSPIDMAYTLYETNKIDYGPDFNPKNGDYLGLGMTVNSSVTVATTTKKYIDRTNFGLNANRFDAKHTDNTRYLHLPGNNTYAGCKWGGWLAASARGATDNEACAVSYLTALKEHMDYKDGPCKNCVITITGYASVQGNSEQYNKEKKDGIEEKEKRNKLLSKKRANNIKKYFENSILDKTEPDWQKRILAETVAIGENDGFGAKYGGVKCTQKMDEDMLSCKLDRRVKVKFDIKAPTTTTEDDAIYIVTETTSTSEIDNALKDAYAECDYFAKIAENDPFTYKKITDKIKFFSPAFHSTTPEGFNARLTFLQQCTRQGPSLYTDTNKPDNLVFGRPPVCVLRIGDFYHTKIIIESMSFDYEPLVWDLNPEGVGVQPMIVNVSLNFAFIGGSSLDGPISRLQNAVSSNYFANTGLFDIRANKNGATYKPDSDVNIDLNDLYEDDVQVTNGNPQIDNTLSLKNEDYDKLFNGKLDVRFAVAGIDRVIGHFRLEEGQYLSKRYSATLITIVSDNKINDNATINDEVIDTSTFDNETDNQGILESSSNLPSNMVRFRSKGKTTNSLQKWKSYFTDTYEPYTGDEVGFRSITYYFRMQKSLDSHVRAYMKENSIEEDSMTGNEADGWDYKKVNEEFITNNQYNYDFIITVDELDFKKTFKARWIPEFKVISSGETGTKEVKQTVNTSGETQNYSSTVKTKKYTYESYLSGGELTIVNEIKGTDNTVSYKTTDEEADDIEKAAKEAKKVAKKAKKEADDIEKAAKEAKKVARAKQKEKIAKDINGSAL